MCLPVLETDTVTSTDERDARIRTEYYAGTSAIELGVEYGLSRSQIHRIVAAGPPVNGYSDDDLDDEDVFGVDDYEPVPVGQEEISQRKFQRHRKARMDARTRERLPVLPVLVRTVDARRNNAITVLQAARDTLPGQSFTVAGETLTRSITRTTEKVWAHDPATGSRRDLGHEEDHAFWAWAAVEILRLTGCRVEELLEISHHSLIQYRLPTSGEIVPLLQIVPSKTDEERLLVVSPELADVLSTVIRRIRDPDGTVPLVAVYDRYECVWRPPAPVLFQRRFPSDIRAISDSSLRTMLNAAFVHTGLKDPSAGINRHEEGDERALHRRSSEPRWPRTMR